MEHFLSQVGLISICAVVLFIMWKVDRQINESDTWNHMPKSDTDSEDGED